jgi:exonuclease III
MINGESIASYNCNGLADENKRLSVFSGLKEKENNVCCLQETLSTILN